MEGGVKDIEKELLGEISNMGEKVEERFQAMLHPIRELRSNHQSSGLLLVTFIRVGGLHASARPCASDPK
jgi:hypothetical protein